MTSALVIPMTTIPSASWVSTRMGGGSVHGSKIYRDGSWGIRVAVRLPMSPSHPLCHKYSPFKVYMVLNKHLCVARRYYTADKALQHLCGRCILDMQQCPMESINVGPNCTLPLGILSPLTPYPMDCINRHELLFEEEFELLPS